MTINCGVTGCLIRGPHWHGTGSTAMAVELQTLTLERDELRKENERLKAEPTYQIRQQQAEEIETLKRQLATAQDELASEIEANTQSAIHCGNHVQRIQSLEAELAQAQAENQKLMEWNGKIELENIRRGEACEAALDYINSVRFLLGRGSFGNDKEVEQKLREAIG